MCATIYLILILQFFFSGRSREFLAFPDFFATAIRKGRGEENRSQDIVRPAGSFIESSRWSAKRYASFLADAEISGKHKAIAYFRGRKSRREFCWRRARRSKRDLRESRPVHRLRARWNAPVTELPRLDLPETPVAGGPRFKTAPPSPLDRNDPYGKIPEDPEPQDAPHRG